jgi:hypothetical protein
MMKWQRPRARSKGKPSSHAELKRTSSIGYGTYRESPPRGDGNVQFFGSGEAKPAPAAPRKRRPAR